MEINEVFGCKKRKKEFLPKFFTFLEGADTALHFEEYVQG